MDVLVQGRDVETAIEAGSLINRNGKTEIEAGTEAETLIPGLEALGHEIEVRALTSGLHGIERLPDGRLRGGADPRREGSVSEPRR
mgnify:CR=1 FL=1